MSDTPSPLSHLPVQGPLLAAVSRSFYLSLRFLPPPVRAPLSVSYLLARAADTIADVEAAPAAAREALLEQFRHAVTVTAGASASAGPAGLEHFLAEVRKVAGLVDHEGERELLRRLSECLDGYRRLAGSVKPEVAAVLGHILDGMVLDLRRFPDHEKLRPLHTDAELDEYTWLVAGCVGEFWTAICASQLPGVYTRSVSEMKSLGGRFGKGLQLINILRDQEKDAAIGRCYLPEESLRAAGLTTPPAWPDPGGWQAWHRVRRDLAARAGEFLRSGWEYASSQRSVRLRFATLMPLLIGQGTLDRMAALPEDGPPAAVKVPRAEVKRMARRALWMALTNRIPAV